MNNNPTKHKVQIHKEKIKLFVVYQIDSNGKVGSSIASFRDREKAESFARMINGED